MLITARKSNRKSKLRVVSIMGGQYGDEGKAKLAEAAARLVAAGSEGMVCEKFDLAQHTAVLSRFGGGENAGHTMVMAIDGVETKIVTHMLPSGAVIPGMLCMIGPMCVVHPAHLLAEVEAAEAHGFADLRMRFVIDPRAHVVLDEYIEGDKAAEQARVDAGLKPIGSTGKGIAQCYAAQAARTGIRIGDIREKIEKFATVMTTDDVFAYYEAGDREVTVVMEGAQSLRLDKVLGDYPFVTSGPCTWDAVFTTGLPHATLSHDVVIVCKMYVTRVGNTSGTFEPANSPVFEAIRDTGGERGATTGRNRDCNYLDLRDLRDIVRRCTPANGKLVFVFNKGDVLEEVAKEYGRDAFGVIRGDKVHKFDNIGEMQAFIIAAMELDYGVPPENLRFSSTPYADPTILQ